LDPSIHESWTCGENLQKQMNQNDSFAKSIRDGYPNDCLYSKILAQPKCHPMFRMHNELLWTHNMNKEWVVCLPHRQIDNQSIHGLVIDQTHTMLGHLGAQCTANYIHHWYWWPCMQHMSHMPDI
jgi:hypothetical protein